jgi:hypothetical protein
MFSLSPFPPFTLSQNLGAGCIIEKRVLEHQPDETRRGLNYIAAFARREGLKY